MGSNVVDLHSLPPPSTEPSSNIIGQSNNFSKYLSPRTLFYDLPNVTKVLVLILITTYILSYIFSGKYLYILGLTPGLTISRFHIWNIFTAAFYHPYFLDLLANVLVLLLAAKFLERFWGSQEYIKFIAIVNIFTGLLSFFTYTLVFLIVGNVNYIFPQIPYGGFGGIVSGFAIAGKQLIPEYEISLFFVFPSRLKHIPTVLLLSNILFAILGLPGTPLPFVIYGAIVSWVYLRFYQRRDGFIGDSSESFSFIMFFPEVMHPILKPIVNFVYIPFSAIDQRRKNEGFGGHTQNINLGFSTTASQSSDAERRRQKALREVDARLARMKSSNSNSQPNSTGNEHEENIIIEEDN